MRERERERTVEREKKKVRDRETQRERERDRDRAGLTLPAKSGRAIIISTDTRPGESLLINQCIANVCFYHPMSFCQYG